MIEEILPKSSARMRILVNIYENPGISITELVRKSNTSPNIVMDYVNMLNKTGAVNDKRLGGRKKTHIRQIYPDTSSDTGMVVFSLVEMQRREKFLEKYPFMKPVQKQLHELLKVTHSFCLVYGSYARMAAEKSSDIDALAVGDIPRVLADRIREIFVTLEAELSLKVETRDKFAQSRGDHLHQNVIREHVILTGEREFLNLMGKPHD